MRFADLTQEQQSEFIKEFSLIIGRTHTTGEIFDLTIETFQKVADWYNIEIQYKNDDYIYYKTCHGCKTEYSVDEINSEEPCPECSEEKDEKIIQEEYYYHSGEMKNRS